MGNCVKSLLVFVLLLKTSLVFSKECDAERVFTLLNAQKNNLKLLIDGSSLEPNAGLVFGEGFLLDKTD